VHQHLCYQKPIRRINVTLEMRQKLVSLKAVVQDCSNSVAQLCDAAPKASLHAAELQRLAKLCKRLPQLLEELGEPAAYEQRQQGVQLLQVTCIRTLVTVYQAQAEPQIAYSAQTGDAAWYKSIALSAPDTQLEVYGSCFRAIVCCYQSKLLAVACCVWSVLLTSRLLAAHVHPVACSA
jgi:hypothetical protein